MSPSKKKGTAPTPEGFHSINRGKREASKRKGAYFLGPPGYVHQMLLGSVRREGGREGGKKIRVAGEKRDGQPTFKGGRFFCSSRTGRIEPLLENGRSFKRKKLLTKGY